MNIEFSIEAHPLNRISSNMYESDENISYSILQLYAVIERQFKKSKVMQFLLDHIHYLNESPLEIWSKIGASSTQG